MANNETVARASKNKPLANKPSKEKNKRKRLYIALWSMMIMFTIGAVSFQVAQFSDLTVVEAELGQAVSAEQAANDELTNDMDYYTSDAFIEKVAREELGYIRSDEYIFYDDAR